MSILFLFNLGLLSLLLEPEAFESYGDSPGEKFGKVSEEIRNSLHKNLTRSCRVVVALDGY